MKKQIAIFFLVLTPIILLSTIHTVNLDGTGDFTVIQQAIDSSADGDTVLVYPGYYVENLNFNGRSIKLYSLEALTGENHYIAETTINGAGVDKVIEIWNQVLVDAEIRGFSITNGYGEGRQGGGGIRISSSGSIKITNCEIFDNKMEYTGGGIYIARDAFVELSGVNIYNNYAGSGGGLSLYPSNNSHLTFSQLNRCSIYNNYSTSGMDICFNLIPYGYNDTTMIYLDKFSELEPSFYYASYDYIVSSDTRNPMIFDILRGHSTPVNADLYVSMNGDDNNSGLTPDDPKYSIVEACRLVEADSLNPKTVYLEAGDYSPQFTDRFYTPVMKQYCRMRGESSETTFLSGSLRDKNLLSAAWGGSNIEISGLTIENTAGRGILFGTDNGKNFKMDDVVIRNCSIESYAGLFISNTSNIEVTNSKFLSNNSGQYSAGLHINGRVDGSGYVLIENCEFAYNVSGYNDDYGLNNSLWAGGDSIIVRNNIFKGNIDSGHENSNAFTLDGNSLSVFENNLVINNHSLRGSATGYVGASNGKVVIRNSTFSGNTISWQQHLTNFAVYGREVEVYNNIFNNPGSVYGSDELLVIFKDSTSVLSLHNNAFRGGEQNISAYPPRLEHLFTYGENNIDADPVFTGGDSTSADYYKLQETSPCVDAGVVEGNEFPLLDLAGNQRIYGNAVDMGCFEWQPVEIFVDPTYKDVKITSSNYPNPFNPSTTIEYSLPESGEVEISIYNIKGQKVKQLVRECQEPGTHTILWDGKDTENKSVGSGVYFYIVKTERESLINKMIMLK